MNLGNDVLNCLLIQEEECVNYSVKSHFFERGGIVMSHNVLFNDGQQCF